MTQKHALISGASIAGPALAFWLRQDGWQVTIVERAPALRKGGYKIDLRGAAVEVVRQMGLLPQVQARAVHMQDSRIMNARGQKVASMPADHFSGRAGPDTELLRGDLVEILAESVAGQVNWLYGDQITALQENPDGVVVSFQHAPAQTFDLVFGADGLNSGLRALAFGPAEGYIHSLGANIAVYSVSHATIPEQIELVTMQPGWSCMLYRTPGQAAKAMFMWRTPQGHTEKGQPADARTYLQNLKPEGHWIIPDILKQLDSASDFYASPISQVRMDQWTRGRVALLGDAAYAPSVASGQGSSLAVVGAYVLAHSLKCFPGQYGLAFAAYEAKMRPFVAANQSLAQANLPGMIPASRMAVSMQLGLMKLLPHLPGQKQLIDRVAGPIQAAANAIDLNNV